MCVANIQQIKQYTIMNWRTW